MEKPPYGSKQNQRQSSYVGQEPNENITSTVTTVLLLKEGNIAHQKLK